MWEEGRAKGYLLSRVIESRPGEKLVLLERLLGKKKKNGKKEELCRKKRSAFSVSLFDQRGHNGEEETFDREKSGTKVASFRKEKGGGVLFPHFGKRRPYASAKALLVQKKKKVS